MGAAVLAAGVFLAPAAHATPSSYISDLESSPYDFYGSKQIYLEIGYGVCHRLAAGMDQDSIITWVIGSTGDGIYEPQARYITEAAEADLCSNPLAQIA